MAQILIRQIDDERLALLKKRAKADRVSVEAMVRQAIYRLVDPVSENRRALAEEVRALLPRQVPGATGTEIIRSYRDTNGGRGSDVFGG